MSRSVFAPQCFAVFGRVSSKDVQQKLSKIEPKPLSEQEIVATTGIRWEQRIRNAFKSYDTDHSGLMNMEALQ